MRVNGLAGAAFAALALTQLPAMAEDMPASVLDIGGVIEVEATQSSDYAGATASDIAVATVELVAAAQVNAVLSAQVVLLYEEGATPLEVDVASVTFHPGQAWSVTAGQTYLPFGHYVSNMVSDPLTLELGETRETAVQLDYESGAWLTSVYLFNGDDKTNKTGHDRIDNFGFNISYSHAGDVNLAVSLSYMNDFANTDGLQGAVSAGTTDEYVAAAALGVLVEAGDVSFIVEHLTALDRFEVAELSFNGGGAQPSATTFELGYGLTLAGKPATIAVGQQMTAEAAALGLPESRTMLSLSLDIADKSILSFELSADSDYSVAEGGTGETASAFTAQLALEF